MDPFSALAIATASLQFFDFARNLFKETGALRSLHRLHFDDQIRALRSCTLALQQVSVGRIGDTVADISQHESVRLRILMIECVSRSPVH